MERMLTAADMVRLLQQARHSSTEISVQTQTGIVTLDGAEYGTIDKETFKKAIDQANLRFEELVNPPKHALYGAPKSTDEERKQVDAWFGERLVKLS
jgi:hypothetical protein